MYGSGFTPASNELWCVGGACANPPSVIFDDLSSDSGTYLVWTVPPALPGSYLLQVRNANGQSNISSFEVTSESAQATNPYANLANILSAIQAILEKMRGGQ